VEDELTRMLDTAIYREIASQALYIAAQSQTQDPAAIVLVKELAEEERKHSQLLKNLREKGLEKLGWHREKVPNLMISDYLTGGNTIDGTSLQDTLVFAMKREQQSIEFYSNMMGIAKDQSTKLLCQKLVHEELKHKLRLETLYEDLFYVDD
jgi:rubrerythrin